MDHKLSKRLAAIAALIPKGVAVADIGTDHAYLPIVLRQTGMICGAIAGDVHEGPYISAKAAVEQAGLQDSIAVRKGDGLNVVAPGEVEWVVIAGMGGTTMIKILSAHLEITHKLGGLILQPMIGAAALRRWLGKNHWRISHEELVWEDEILYQIIAAVPGEMEPLEPILEEIGPLLWSQKHRFLADHLEALLEQTNRILISMAVSAKACHSDKYRQLLEQRSQLEAKRLCL